jgi:hypothetical protein
MVAQDGITATAEVGRWAEALEELHGRIAHRFAGSETRKRARRYLVGLLGRVERKNGWQLTEAIGGTDPQGVQTLLNLAKWDAETTVRDELREHVVEHLGGFWRGVLDRLLLRTQPFYDVEGFRRRNFAKVQHRLVLVGEAARPKNQASASTPAAHEEARAPSPVLT